jgi:hypothetical protein
MDHSETDCKDEKRKAMAQDHLDCMANVLTGSHQSTFSKSNTELNSDLNPCNFWAFPTMKRELRGKKFQSDQQSAACFQEVGGAV